jgi:hypothetical protein
MRELLMQEPANPFYRLLLAVSFIFVLTALAYALLPWNEQPEWLRQHGWRILLVEVAGIILFGLLSMTLDRVRSTKSGVRSAESPVDERHPDSNPLGETADPR